jgi:hypothetical protein
MESQKLFKYIYNMDIKRKITQSNTLVISDYE